MRLAAAGFVRVGSAVASLWPWRITLFTGSDGIPHGSEIHGIEMENLPLETVEFVGWTLSPRITRTFTSELWNFECRNAWIMCNSAMQRENVISVKCE